MSLLNRIREAFRLPDIYCEECGKVLVTEDDYTAHVAEFPSHRVVPK